MTLFGTNSKYCDSILKVSVDLMLRKDHVASLELLSEARELAEKNKWYKQLFLVQNNIGNNYYMLLDYGEALKQYLESYKIATSHLDGTQIMIVLNNIAILYSKEKKYDKANAHFTKALVLAQKYNDSLKIGLYTMNLGLLANEENKLQQARNYFNKSLQYSKMPEIRIPTLVGLYNNDLLLGNIKESRLQAEKLLSNLKNEQNNDNKIDLSLIIAKSFLKENNLVEALQWTNVIFTEKPDLEKKIELYDLLSNIYFRLKSYPLAFQYKDSITISNSRLNTIKNSKLYESSEVKFQIQNYKEKIIEKETRIKNERKLFYSILMVIVFAVIILLLIFRNYFIKAKQKELLAKREQQLITFKLEKEMAENSLLLEKEKTALLEKESLQNEIQLRNQRILSRALYISGRNQLLQDILKSFSTIPSDNNTIINTIQALKEHLKTDDDWENYVRHFDEVNQGFIKRLTEKHPDLTTTDIRYISYVYMNLDTKEIATMLNITPVACRKRKERIEKRLELPNDISLNAYLLSV
ncbi:tetratricopeptide repeat protein [Flavobacterium jejuense]|uniref:Tetratricopeptide repeat protein n=1 Tax=Flavobacterium jejuense TaxID=1544455 RepID=A0ABX0INN2_9FLAO|nr:tetratricopeptide repeat protein [Flavobacterium jejuense]NHN24567.1 tetratricopeptide repeat protein [Flavobacterium jejuense]